MLAVTQLAPDSCGDVTTLRGVDGRRPLDDKLQLCLK